MKTIAILGTIALLSTIAGCEKSRFPTCKDDAECASRSNGKAAPLCYDLRCVSCRIDSDCGPDHMCNTSNECKALGGAGPKEQPTPPPPPATAVPSAEPSTSAAAPSASASAAPSAKPAAPKK